MICRDDDMKGGLSGHLFFVGCLRCCNYAKRLGAGMSSTDISIR